MQKQASGVGANGAGQEIRHAFRAKAGEAFAVVITVAARRWGQRNGAIAGKRIAGSGLTHGAGLFTQRGALGAGRAGVAGRTGFTRWAGLAGCPCFAGGPGFAGRPCFARGALIAAAAIRSCCCLGIRCCNLCCNRSSSGRRNIIIPVTARLAGTAAITAALFSRRFH
jgi:hypothetical protein